MIDFEWDNDKAAANFRKHGVTFGQAAYAFRDPFGIEWVDDSADYGEERVILLGMSGGQILSVVYTDTWSATSDPYYLGTQGNET